MFQGGLEEQAFRRKTCKRLIIITVSVVVLVAIVIAAVVGMASSLRNKSSQKNRPDTKVEMIKSICQVTLYPNLCASGISSLKSSSNSIKLDQPEELLLLSFQVTVNELVNLSAFPRMLIEINDIVDTMAKDALSICEGVIWDAIEYVNMSMFSMKAAFEAKDAKILLSVSTINDVRTWLSTAMTYQETCLNGLVEMEYSKTNTTLLEDMKIAARNATKFTSNSLAIVTKIWDTLGIPIPTNRKLLHVEADGFPGWYPYYSVGDRKLLQVHCVNDLPKAIVTVDQKDGTGDFSAIREAVSIVPEKNRLRFVIYVKAFTWKTCTLTNVHGT